MHRYRRDNPRAPGSQERAERESTLLPMLIGGLVLIVIGAGVVMTVV